MKATTGSDLRWISSMMTDLSPIPTAEDRATWRAQLENAADQLEAMQGDLLDQGISRLQLLAFLRGAESDMWNGSDSRGGSRWVRYRAHQVDRVPTPDGNWVNIAYTNHDGTTNDAGWTIGTINVEDALVTARMIDQIIDAAIAHHGPDGVA